MEKKCFRVTVFLQHDGQQTAINNRSVVEMILFIILGWGERIQLYKKEEKTKMLTIHVQAGKTPVLSEKLL